MLPVTNPEHQEMPSNDTVAKPQANDRITLQVGERHFVTYASTLRSESPFFDSLLSTRWKQTQPDGSIFVDADGDTFSHVLQYLRSATFPLFYSGSTGHDYGRYNALQKQAEYFGIERLETWLKNATYEKAVEVEYSIHCSNDVPNTSTPYRSNTSISYHSNTQVEYIPYVKTKRVYVCPRGLECHRGSPSSCGKACRQAQGDKENSYEEVDEVGTTKVIKKTKFNYKLCL